MHETLSPPVPTDHQRVEAEERESDRQLHTLIDNLPGMVFSATGDRTRTLSFVSEGCLELTGRTAAELTGPPPRGLTRLIHPEDQERVITTVQWALA
ncbi:MAG: PAS domain-containing protein, partial [Desulfobulbaceae bacterium]|nr:PAS domain-containing protein [Desulfobulbaceae bacterium]